MFWIAITLLIAAAIAVYAISEKIYPYIYLKYTLGSIFVLFLPGFPLIKTLFHTREIDNIECTALSIGMSLALVPLVGLLLNYTPRGIILTPARASGHEYHPTHNIRTHYTSLQKDKHASQ